MLSERDFRQMKDQMLPGAVSTNLLPIARKRFMEGRLSEGDTTQVIYWQEGNRYYKITGTLSTKDIAIEGLLVYEKKRSVKPMEALTIDSHGEIMSSGVEIDPRDERLALLKGDLHTGMEIPRGLYEDLERRVTPSTPVTSVV